MYTEFSNWTILTEFIAKENMYILSLTEIKTIYDYIEGAARIQPSDQITYLLNNQLYQIQHISLFQKLVSCYQSDNISFLYEEGFLRFSQITKFGKIGRDLFGVVIGMG